MKPIVFDNLVDKMREPIGESIQAEFSNKPVVDAERPLGLWPPHMTTAEVGERARLAGQRFLAMFGRE